LKGFELLNSDFEQKEEKEKEEGGKNILFFVWNGREEILTLTSQKQKN
jgi:hypothetical protein